MKRALFLAACGLFFLATAPLRLAVALLLAGLLVVAWAVTPGVRLAELGDAFGRVGVFLVFGRLAALSR